MAEMAEMDERYKRGLDRMQEVLGPQGDAVLGSLAEVAPDMGRFVVEFAYGDVHTRPGLDRRQRSLLAVGVLSSIGGCEPLLSAHVHGALNVGLDPAEVVEAVMQCAVYAGFPRALGALEVVRAVFAERGLIPCPPAPAP
ncbi:carboxymuconolactone decarboxylase family protein [Streptomyces sp. ACA25]|uniref:carboxymuconolactone decarboxylase family protein n=1 Tax=Streptomyces sp. ACA25 TaxID=3022596 RepID=UPI0023071F00|nr:carboxymuconolactone decarboxylase family protein [Streptomyces sp. ACA25]MDB1089797.1 carboxymuconolactone decarboxylase family protein [Streptomyces sp. ACA25]